MWERARDYNDHIEYTRQNKAAKLQEFQREVKERVKRIEEQKQRVLARKTMLEVVYIYADIASDGSSLIKRLGSLYVKFIF